MIEIRLNGQPRRIESGTRVLDLVRELAGDPDRAGVAVARNREVIPRSRWDETILTDGDQVEIVAPFQGG